MADDAGALLVRSGLVSPSALDDARARVAKLGGTVGEQLVTIGAISDDALTDFYRSRLLVPQVNPNTLARLPAKVVAALPGDMAIELRAVPVALDGDNNLTVAMSDPSDRHAVDEIAFFTGAYVVRAVATQMQIAWCLAHYYGHVTALGQRLLHTSGAEPPASPGPVPRVKGVTGQVEAMRHRGLPPGEVVALGTAEAGSDGVPDQPRARSISGEIRVPGRRAPSIRPPMPDPIGDDEESGPVITVVIGTPDDAPTGPRKVPVRKRKAKTDPPELAARAGEVSIATGPARQVDLEEPRIIIADDIAAPPPTMLVTETTGELRAIARDLGPGVPTTTIEVSDEASTGVVIDQRVDAESAPILLERKRPIAAEPQIGDDTDVVLLAAKKPAPRPDRRTQMGIGALPAVTRTHRDTETTEPPDLERTTVNMQAVPRADDDSSDEIVAPPAPPSSDDTDPNVLAAPPRPAAPRARSGPIDPAAPLSSDDDDDDEMGPTTSVMSAVELDEAIPQRSSEVIPAHLAKQQLDDDSIDDGWGPPGTTIPPPLLGAIPGSDDDTMPGSIPVADVDPAPLIVAAAVAAGAATSATRCLARALEDATARLLELIRDARSGTRARRGRRGDDRSTSRRAITAPGSS